MDSSLLGRGAVLTRVDLLLAATRSGRGGLLWLHGDAGIGKTRLIDAVAERAEGSCVLRAAGWEDPGTPAFWLWTQVVRAAAAVLPQEQWDERAGRATTLLGAGPSEDAAGRFPLFDGVDGLLDLLAQRAPVVLLLDDLHWVDAGSLELLRFVAGSAVTRPLLVVCGWRDHDHELDETRRALVDGVTTRGETWLLEGLDEDDVGALIAATTGAAPQADDARAVAERTGGNPLFVGEMARLARARGADKVATVVPETAQATIRRRVARLAQPVESALCAAAVLGASLSWGRLAALLGVPPAELAPLVDALVEAGLLRLDGERLGFSHALVRDAVYDGLPAVRRRELHLAVARDLDPSDVAGLAHHLVRARPLVEDAEVVAACERAARAASSVHAWEDAAAWCATAKDLTAAGSAERAGLAQLHGELCLALGEFEAARELFTEVAAIGRGLGDPELVARAALGFASGLSGFEVRLFDRAQVELLEEALDLVGANDSALRVLLLARLSVALSFTTSADVCRTMADEAVAMGRRVGEPGPLAAALAAHNDTISGPDWSEQREADATEVIVLAREVGDPGLELLGLRHRLMSRWEQGDMAGGQQDVHAFEALAARLRQPSYSWFVPLWRGARAHLAGDLARMEECAREAERIGAQGSSRNAAVLGVVQRAWTWNERDRYADAMATFFEMFGDMPELAGGGVSWIRLFPGNPREVHEAALAAMPGLLDELPVDSEWVSAIAAAAEGLWQHGSGGAPARLLHDVLAPYAHRFMVDGIGAGLMGSVELVLAQLATLFGDLDLAEQHFTAAARANAAIEAPLARARTQRRHAEMLERRGRPGDEERRRALVEEALAFYRRVGIEEHVAALEAALGAPAPTGAALRRDGDLWTVRWAGCEVVLPAVKGLADLAVLLRQPGREVHVLDLVGVPTERRGDLGPVLDDAARAAYRARLAELDDLADEGDEAAAREREALVAELSSAYGLGGRVRRAGDPAERARTTVTSRIRDAIGRVDAQLPELGRHLRASVRTGVYCSYSPETPTTWEVGPTS